MIVSSKDLIPGDLVIEVTNRLGYTVFVPSRKPFLALESIEDESANFDVRGLLGSPSPDNVTSLIEDYYIHESDQVTIFRR